MKTSEPYFNALNHSILNNFMSPNKTYFDSENIDQVSCKNTKKMLLLLMSTTVKMTPKTTMKLSY